MARSPRSILFRTGSSHRPSSPPAFAPRIASLLFLLFFSSCAATPDIRLSAADMTMELRESAYRVSAVAVSPDGNYIASGDVNGDVTVWDIRNGRLRWKVNGHGTTGPATNDNWVWSAAFTPDGRYLLTGGGKHVIKVWDVEKGTLAKTLEGHEGSAFSGTASINSIAVSPDGRTAVSGGGDGTVRVWDVEKGALAKAFRANDSWGGRGMVLSVDVSPDGRYSLASGGDDVITLWDNETGRELLRKKVATDFNETWLNSVVFMKDGTRFVSGGHTLRYWDLRTGSLLREVKEEGCGAQSLALSNDGKLLLASGCRTISLRNADTGQLLRSYKGNAGYPAARIFDAAVFHPNGKWIVTKGVDASVRIKDRETDEEIALFVGFPDNEWIVITSEGYYNASEKGAQHLSAIADGAKYGMNLFYDVFYRPDIVSAKLQGEAIRDLVTITMQDAMKSPPPEIEIAQPVEKGASAKVCFRVKSAGGGVGEVRLFHNGKLVRSDGFYRDMARSAPQKRLLALNSKAIYENMRSVRLIGKTGSAPITGAPKGESFEDCSELEAVPGENEVSVAAFNGNNTVQSRLKTVRFTSAVKPQVPRLYILSVGIDKYKDTTVNLKYAAKDAAALEEKLVHQSATIYKAENIRFELLVDDRATKRNILAGIDELSRTVKPNDSFVLFVAGHGVLLQNQYYMLTHDYDGAVNDADTISSNEIVEMSKKIKALTQLLIFDTCHAGGVDGIVSGLYDARMSVLAKKMGLHIYASASSIQEAQDGYRGNGLFTFMLLDGLNNQRQADKNNDNAVSLAELGEYAKQATAQISKKSGRAQTPLIINFGKDGPVYTLR